MLRRLALVLLVLVSVSSFWRAEAVGNSLTIQGGQLLDVKTGKLHPNRRLVVEDGRIVALEIGAADSCRRSPANVCLTPQALITPSFVDTHNHLDLSLGEETFGEIANDPNAALGALSKLYLPYGVTHVRSAGNPLNLLGTFATLPKGDGRNIDFYPTGGALTHLNTGFHNHTFYQSLSELSDVFNTVKKRGARHVKLYNFIPESHLAFIVAKAREQDLALMVHFEGNYVSIQAALKVGIKQFEHIKTLFTNQFYRFEEQFKDSPLSPDDDENWLLREFEIFSLIGADSDLMAGLVEKFDHTVFLAPTLAVYKKPLDDLAASAEEGAAPSPRSAKMERGYRELEKLAAKLHEKGVKLVAGSDLEHPGEVIIEEMRLLMKAGIAPADVFRIATLNGAEALRIDAETGSLEPGKRANILIFDNNPIRQPAALQKPVMVIKDGCRVSAEGE